jgi:iron complex transport system permease protein
VNEAPRKTLIVVLSLALPFILAAVILGSASFGSANIGFRDSSGIILNRIFPFLDWHYPRTMELIILQIRLPRIILALLVGTGLAAGGVVFQGVFRNPMADPYVLGVSSGAAFGVTLAMVTGAAALPLLGTGLVPASAFLGAMAATLLVLGVAGGIQDSSLISLLLAGIAVSFLLSAGISLMMYLNREQVESIVIWTFGSFSAAGWEQILLAGPIILAGSVLIFFFSRDLDLLSLGEDTASTLGLHVPRTRLFLLVCATLISAAAVMVSGIIGFVGLIVPHAVRIITGPRHKLLIPWAMFSGALFCVLSDILARTLLEPTEIPVGIITALFGAPYFLYLLRRRSKGSS